MYTGSEYFRMAIRLKKENGEIHITLTNGHCNLIENVQERYSLGNQAQALDFILKAIGDTKDKVSTLTVGGVDYTPDGYDKSG